MRKITLILALLLFTFAFSQTSVPQLILTDQVWNEAGSPYIIDKSVFIDSGITVTALPGTQIIGTGTYLKVDIDGNFQIHGTKDSNVIVNNLEFSYSQKSGQFQKAAGHTTEIRHATIKGSGVGRRLFYLSGGIDFGVFNTVVDSSYYTIQYFNNSSGTSGSVTLDSCDFEGVDGTQGYILYLSGYEIETNITNSYLHDARYVYLSGEINASGNIFENLNACKIPKNASKNVLATCNTFSNVGEINCALSFNQDTTTTFSFKNNSIDSMSKSTFNISGSLSGGPLPILDISLNNFEGTGTKAKISVFNADKTTFEVVDMSNNYWGTTDSVSIDEAIIDYNDDVAYFAKIDFNNPLANRVNGCQESGCPTPNIAYLQSDNMFVFYDSANASNTSRIWDFGDGNSDSTSTDSVSYGYSSGGTYTVCLYTIDGSGNICDSSCTQVIVPNLFCEATYFVAIDSTDPFNLFIVNTSTGVTPNTSYTWSFGDGTQVNSETPSHAYDDFGEYNVCLSISDINGCNSVYCDSLGMDENGNVLKKAGFTIRVLNQTQLADVGSNLNSEDINVYPNPADQYVMVALDNLNSNDMQLRMLNNIGEEVLNGSEMRMTGKNSIRINTAQLTQGLYILHLSSNGLVLTRKIIIE